MTRCLLYGTKNAFAVWLAYQVNGPYYAARTGKRRALAGTDEGVAASVRTDVQSRGMSRLYRQLRLEINSELILT